MTAYAATMAYPCHCGAITHIFLECDEDPCLAAISCCSCGEAVGLALVSRLWSASTPEGACRIRLIGWEAGLSAPRGPPFHEAPELQVWRVV
jgi:hypothetical protein